MLRWVYFVSTEGDYLLKSMCLVISKSGGRNHSLYRKFSFQCSSSLNETLNNGGYLDGGRNAIAPNVGWNKDLSFEDIRKKQ